MVEIRRFDAARDTVTLREFVGALQDALHALDARVGAGDVVGEQYTAHLISRCAEWAGMILVAEEGGRPIGFCCVFGRVAPDPDEQPHAYGYVSDLFVAESHRGRGIGTQLLQQAEDWARAQGATELGIGVVKPNQRAYRLYRALGFEDYTIQLRKPLT